MFRCEFEVESNKICNKRVMLGRSECKYCSKHYCKAHYLLEDHECIHIDKMKEVKRQLLKEQLMNGKATFPKLAQV